MNKDIIIIGNKRYKLGPTGRKRLLCNFENCDNLDKKGGFCQKHEGVVLNIRLYVKESRSISDDGIEIKSNEEFRKKCKLTNSTGDDTEIFVEKIISKLNTVQECSRIGHIG